MRVAFNPSGTHVSGGRLRMRVDVYPSDKDKTYARQYVDKPTRPLTQAEMDDPALAALVPKVKSLNPCLCHFITVSSSTPRLDLAKLMQSMFDKSTLGQLDTLLSQTEIPLAAVNEVMKTKLGNGLPVGLVDEAALVDSVNARFNGLEVKV